MANFAPDVQPQQDRDYTSYSKPIQRPIADVSGETRGRAVGNILKESGNAIQEGANLGNQVEQDIIAKKMKDQYDPLSADYVTRLSNVDDVMSGRKSVDILQPSSQEVPSGLKTLPGTVNDLIAIRDSGKVSATYFDMKKDAIAKQVRSEYPGQREFIDNEFSRLTERDPANKVIQSLTSDINASAANLKEARNKTENLIYDGIKQGMPNSDKMLGAFQNGKVDANGVAKWYNSSMSRSWNRKQEMDDLAVAKGNLELQQMKAGQVITNKASDIVNETFSGMYTAAGMHTDEYAQKVLSGELPHMSEVQASQLADQIAGRKAQAMAEFNKWADTVDPRTGQSPRMIMGPEKTQQAVAPIMARFDDTAKLFRDKDIGLAYAAHRFGEHKADDTQYGLLTNKDTSDYYSMSLAVSKMGPGFGKAFADQLLGSSVPAQIAPYFNFTSTEAVTQPSGPKHIDTGSTEDLRAVIGKPFTMRQDIDEAKAKGIAGKDMDLYAQGKLKLVDTITNPNTPDEAKANLVRYAFSPQNEGFFNSLSDRDKFPTFQRMYSPGMTKEVKRLSQEGDSSLWQNYSTVAQNQFGSELFHPEIMDLNSYPGNNQVSLSWDDVNHQFNASYWGKDEPPADFYRTKNSISRLNQGLKVISNISKVDNIDVNEYVLKLMIASGLSPDSDAAKALEAIKASGRKTSNFPGQE